MRDLEIDFIGIGAAKSGSTWVAQCLHEHPDILFSGNKSTKELNFFNKDVFGKFRKEGYENYHKGIDWYLSQFPAPKPDKIRGEYSVSYLHDTEAPKRIKEALPGVKLLVALRNPVDMLNSFYYFLQSGVYTKMADTFEEQLKNKDFVDIGMYYLYLKNYYELFNADKIYVVLLDEIISVPEKTIRGVFDFLGVDKNFKPSVLDTKVNATFKPKSEVLKKGAQGILAILRSLGLEHAHESITHNKTLYQIYSRLNKEKWKYPKVDAATRKNLTKIFSEDIKKLEQLIDKDLSMWTKSETGVKT